MTVNSTGAAVRPDLEDRQADQNPRGQCDIQAPLAERRTSARETTMAPPGFSEQLADPVPSR
jgi:hypothetical protein